MIDGKLFDKLVRAIEHTISHAEIRNQHASVGVCSP